VDRSPAALRRRRRAVRRRPAPRSGGFGAGAAFGSTRMRRAASASTFRIDSSSDRRSRVISDSERGGVMLRNWPTSAVRARS
jgi:hypothetical protein